MIKYLNCDCINSKCSALVNQINLSGNMDYHSGLEFSTRFPKMYEDYLNRYHSKSLSLGQGYLYQDKDQKIINLVCYESYAFPTSLEIVEKSLKFFVKHYEEYDLKEIAFPLLGCDEEGLRMILVLPLMEKYLKSLPIDCYICFDIEGPSNIELQMIEAFKDLNYADLKAYVGLDDIQMAGLESLKPVVVRFDDIFRLSNIDAKSYRKIYEYFYNGKYQRLSPFHQETLF